MQCRVENYSSLFLHPDYRWDAEYVCYQPYKNEELEYVPIGKILDSSQYGVSIEMNEEGVGTPIYRMNEISNILCDRDVSKYAELSQTEVAAYKLKDRDVLFNRTNSQAFVGRTGIYRQYSEDDAVFASYLVRVKPDQSKVTPEYLTAFLNTKYGVQDVRRRARISINQSNVNAEELKRVEIPLLCQYLQSRITRFFDIAFELLKESSQLHNMAQVRLLAEIGLLEWEPNSPLTFEVYFSELQRAGRFDAEYFQPKYQEIVEAIKGYAGGWDRLGNLVRAKAQNFVPDDDAEYRYIELSNIGGSGEITGCMEGPGKSLPTRARRRVVAGDVIVSSIEGSLGSIAMIDEEYDQALCSTGFHVINSDRLNSETLLVLLKSVAGQLQLKRGATGTILTAINRDEFSQVVLPLVSEEAQAAIREMVTEANDLRQESKYLLACAIRVVEMAIEQDEETAAGWLETEIEGVG